MDAYPRPLDVALPADGRAPAAGRRAAARYFAGLPDRRCTDMVTVVSELVTNAVLYGGTPVVLHMHWDSLGAYVEVEDGAADMAPPRKDSRGLRIVERIAVRWGITQWPDHKSVWAYLPTAPLLA